jgi:hypothetical protein
VENRGAHERVPELQPAVEDPDEARVLGRLERLGGQIEADQPGHDHLCLAGVANGRHHQGVLGALGQRLGTPRECAFNGRSGGQRVAQWRRPGQLFRRKQPGQLQQRQRVAVRRDVQLVRDLRGKRGLIRPAEQVGSRLARQPGEGERLDARRLEGPLLAVARSEEESSAVRLKPLGRKDQRVLGRRIQPLRIVDEDADRIRLGEGGQQAQGRGADREPIPLLPRADAERGTEHVRLMVGQLVERVAHRPAHLEQPGELQLRLRLHAQSPDDGHVIRARGGVIEEGCLPDAGLAADHQRAGSAHPGPIEQLVEASALALTADQHT